MMFTVSDVSGFVLESIWFPYFGIGSCRHSYPFDTEERAVIEHNARAFPFLGASQEGVKRAAAKRPPSGGSKNFFPAIRSLNLTKPRGFFGN